MNWYNIIITILFIIAGFFVEYLKTKKNLLESVNDVINKAEEEYKDATKAGGLKMQWAIDLLFSYTPAFLKPFITKEVIGNMIQSAFDRIEDYAKKQLDKVVDKIVPEEE